MFHFEVEVALKYSGDCADAYLRSFAMEMIKENVPRLMHLISSYYEISAVS